jgi:hypothetical protein
MASDNKLRARRERDPPRAGRPRGAVGFRHAPASFGYEAILGPMSRGVQCMLYSILCYESEDIAAARSPEEDASLVKRIIGVQKKLAAEGKLGTAARLMPTTAAMTIHCGRQPLVLDGPFMETKEQLLGFYVIECGSLEEAIGVACQLASEKPSGALEVRPIALLNPVRS